MRNRDSLAGPIELTTFASAHGLLTKRISLDANRLLHSDGSACLLSDGTACRTPLGSLAAVANHIDALRSNEAIALGRLRPDLPDQVRIVPAHRLGPPTDAATGEVIARTRDNIVFESDCFALLLIDIDTKGMPPAVKERIRAAGGLSQALALVAPDLAGAGRIVRKSTSTGIFCGDTGQRFPGSGGFHMYVLVEDGADIPRALSILHDRCWLHGFGWMTISKSGQLSNRSIVDRMVAGPERLVFEGPPVLRPPLLQDQAGRAPVVSEGPPFDTRRACLGLGDVEKAKLRDLHLGERRRLADAAESIRAQYIADQSDLVAKRTRCSLGAARRIVERQCAGILHPDVVLPFDADEFKGKRVREVLARPHRYVGATLADPLEGSNYGQNKAMIMQRADGSLWINSFAHGHSTYELKYDAASIERALTVGGAADAADLLVSMLLVGDIAPDEEQRLREIVCRRTGMPPKPLTTKIRAARADQKAQRIKAEQERRQAERTDPRPQIAVPPPNAEWLPQMTILNDALGSSSAPEPPMRNIEGVMTQVTARRLPRLHALTAAGANGEAEERPLPPPELPLLTALDEMEVAEEIERHIEYIDDGERPVHLPTPFVKHYRKRTDDALPVVVAVATLPILLADGSLLATPGLDRSRGIVVRIPEEIRSRLPQREDCSAAAVRAAFEFLVNVWLVDVATDITGKCVIIAAALTLIERSVLPERPVFFVTAGHRGGGKTTTLIMLLLAIIGVRPPAAAWSPNDEERRKALLAYLLAGVPAIVWDNIPRGTQISCPHIERSSTSAFYADRKLGVSEMVAVAAATVHLFTGNNIAPQGDLASRSLRAKLTVERADPENRLFTHADPIAWTEVHRSNILHALYTLLLGNPALRPGSGVMPKTRFKLWGRLVGSAVEHAAKLAGETLDFQALFLSQEEDDEDGAALGEALTALHAKWPDEQPFKSADIEMMINDQSEYSVDTSRSRVLREFLFPEQALKSNMPMTARGVGKRLKRHIDGPVKVGIETLCLKIGPKPPGKPDMAASYFIRVTPDQP